MPSSSPIPRRSILRTVFYSLLPAAVLLVCLELVLFLLGLDAPDTSIALRLTGGPSIGKSILFGGDAGPNAVYAMIQGLDVVFTVEKARRDRMLRPLVRKPPEAPGATSVGGTRDAPGG